MPRSARWRSNVWAGLTGCLYATAITGAVEHSALVALGSWAIGTVAAVKWLNA